MTLDLNDWDIDLPNSPEEDYQAFIRGLRRQKGFGLFFVECSPAEGEKLIQQVQKDLPRKIIEVLRLTEPTDDLYTKVNDLSNRDNINILFISGLEHSLYDYEQRKLTQGWSSREKYTYSWKGVPPILSHLNQQRERFRDDFKMCIVFLVPKFILNYFIHRAPDFFDWRSGFIELPSDPEFLTQKSIQLIEEGDSQKYKDLTLDEQREKFFDIQGLLVEADLSSDDQAKLYRELGRLLAATQNYEEAIASYDKAVEIQPDYAQAWNNRGLELYYLERYTEAVQSYDKALEIQPDDAKAWYNRGFALLKLERYTEALQSFDKAVEIQPDYADVWNNRGVALYNLERYTEAIQSYDKAVEIQPDVAYAWNNRGNALGKLERYTEAIQSYDKALEIKPDDASAWNNRGVALRKLERYTEALQSYDKALEIQPDDADVWNNRGVALYNLERYTEAIQSYDKAVEIQPDVAYAWNNRGNALGKLERYTEAIQSFDKAIEIELNNGIAWNNGGIRLRQLGRYLILNILKYIFRCLK
ncbi:MAG: tetratricopeptide repeat protein [Cyanobacteria bacterium J06592_8]